MAELRGGVDAMPRNIAHQASRCVHLLLLDRLSRTTPADQSTCRLDSMASWCFQSKPRLPMYRSRFRGESFSLSGARPHLPGSPFDNDRFEKLLWKSMFTCACDIQLLANLLDLHTRQPNKIGAKEREFFEDNYAAIQHILVSMPHPADLVAKSDMYYRNDCWRLGALLYFNMSIRQSPSPNLLKSMTSRLLESFQESDMSSIWAPFPDVLLWILFMASCAAWDKSEKDWFVLELRDVVSVLGLKSVDEMESLLESFLYRSIISREPLRHLWMEHLA